MSEETAKTGKEIVIEIDPKPMQELLERAKKAEDDAEGFRELASDLSKSMQKEGIVIDSRDITKDNFKEQVHKLYEEQAKTKEVLAELENRDYGGVGSSVGEGSAGRSLLQGDQSGKKSFDSHEELIDYLQDEQARGNKVAEEQLNRLMSKTLKGIVEQKKSIGDYKVLDVNDPIIEKYREKGNVDEQIKLKQKVKKDVK